jgi:hypothetical protein
VAIDCNMPERMVTLLQTGFGQQGFEFIHESKFADRRDDDEHWVEKFRQFGGRVVLSADRNIGKRPHQRLAFKRAGMKTFFLHQKWHTFSMSYRAAHLIQWWPRVADQLRQMRNGDAFWVPPSMEGAFKAVEVPEEVLNAARKVAKR